MIGCTGYMGSVAQAMWDQLHRLYVMDAKAMWEQLHRLHGISCTGYEGPFAQAMWDQLHKLCGISCTNYMVRCRGYMGMLYKRCGVETDYKAKQAQFS